MFLPPCRPCPGRRLLGAPQASRRCAGRARADPFSRAQSARSDLSNARINIQDDSQGLQQSASSSAAVAAGSSCRCGEGDGQACGAAGRSFLSRCRAECDGHIVAHDGLCQQLLVSEQAGAGGRPRSGGASTAAKLSSQGACPYCSNVYSPVCGANGATYSNACRAQCKQVAVVGRGPCADASAAAAPPLRRTPPTSLRGSSGEPPAIRAATVRAVPTPTLSEHRAQPLQPPPRLASPGLLPLPPRPPRPPPLQQQQQQQPQQQPRPPAALAGGGLYSTAACRLPSKACSNCSTADDAPVCTFSGVTLRGRCVAACAGMAVAYSGPCRGEALARCPRERCDAHGRARQALRRRQRCRLPTLLQAFSLPHRPLAAVEAFHCRPPALLTSGLAGRPAPGPGPVTRPSAVTTAAVTAAFTAAVTTAAVTAASTAAAAPAPGCFCANTRPHYVCTATGATATSPCAAACAGLATSAEGACEAAQQPAQQPSNCAICRSMPPGSACSTTGILLPSACLARCNAIPLGPRRPTCSTAPPPPPPRPATCLCPPEAPGQVGAAAAAAGCCARTLRRCAAPAAAARASTLSAAPPLPQRPVCASDGVTYASECSAACAGARPVHLGPCRAQLADVRPPAETCSCSRVQQPVCGVDGLTYINECTAACSGAAVVGALHKAGCCACCPAAAGWLAAGCWLSASRCCTAGALTRPPPARRSCEAAAPRPPHCQRAPARTCPRRSAFAAQMVPPTAAAAPPAAQAWRWPTWAPAPPRGGLSAAPAPPPMRPCAAPTASPTRASAWRAASAPPCSSVRPAPEVGAAAAHAIPALAAHTAMPGQLLRLLCPQSYPFAFMPPCRAAGPPGPQLVDTICGGPLSWCAAAGACPGTACRRGVCRPTGPHYWRCAA
jgi:hypothetical protein